MKRVILVTLAIMASSPGISEVNAATINASSCSAKDVQSSINSASNGDTVTVPAGDRTLQGMGLAPMAVLPEHQRDGIGARLVEEGVVRLERAGCPFVIVLGHPGYYPRFGFERASAHGIRCQWPVPDEAFMIRVFSPLAMAGAAGVARYRPEFDAVVSRVNR